MNRLCIIILLVSIISLVGFTPASSLRESSTQDSTRPQLRSNIANTTESEANDGIVTKNEAPSTVNVSSESSQVFDGPYFDVTPSDVPITAVGETFTVAVALHNVTVEDVPAGLSALQVILAWNSSLVEPVNVTTDIGVPDVGVLCGPVFFVTNGFYDNNAPSINSMYALSAPYTDAVEYAVCAVTLGENPWWSTNSTGTVALITFRVKSAPTSQSTVCSLQLDNQTELLDDNNNEVPYNLVSPCAPAPAPTNQTSEPEISNFWTSVCDGDYPVWGDEVIIGVHAAYASACIISYTDVPQGNSLNEANWTNVTMTVTGSDGSNPGFYYGGNFSVSSFPWASMVYYKLYVNDVYGHSVVAEPSSFLLWEINVTDDVTPSGGAETILPPSGLVNVTATTEHADNCILSYTFMCWDGDPGLLSPPATLSSIYNGTVWTNVTMTRNGNSYSGIIDANPVWSAFPYTELIYRVIAISPLGISGESASVGYQSWWPDC
jgi:hypothetical protein